MIFVTPYLTEEYQKNHLKYQKERFDAIIYPEIEDKPLKFAISYRNKWMIEKADLVVCYIERAWGGAYKIRRVYMPKGRKRTYITLSKNKDCLISLLNKSFLYSVEKAFIF